MLGHFRLSACILVIALIVSCIGCQPNHDASSEHNLHVDHSPLPGLPVGRIAVGKQLASTKDPNIGMSCSSCHGSNGNSPLAPGYPYIGGQYDDYLAYALTQYRAKNRLHPVMNAQAARLSDQDIADLAVYFGSQPRKIRDLH